MMILRECRFDMAWGTTCGMYITLLPNSVLYTHYIDFNFSILDEVIKIHNGDIRFIGRWGQLYMIN